MLSAPASSCGVHRAYGNLGQFILDSNGNGSWDLADQASFYGVTSDTPLIGDWNGDGQDEIGVHRAYGNLGQFILDSNGKGSWDPQDRASFYGIAGDTPLIGNWLGSRASGFESHLIIPSAGRH